MAFSFFKADRKRCFFTSSSRITAHGVTGLQFSKFRARFPPRCKGTKWWNWWIFLFSLSIVIWRRQMVRKIGDEDDRRFPPIPIPIPPLFHAWFRPSSSFFLSLEYVGRRRRRRQIFPRFGRRRRTTKAEKKFAHIRAIFFWKMQKYCIITTHLSSLNCCKPFILVFDRTVEKRIPIIFPQTDDKQLPRQPSNFEKKYIHRKHYAFPQNCSSSVLKKSTISSIAPPPLALICSIPIVLCSSPPLLFPLIHSHYLL